MCRMLLIKRFQLWPRMQAELLCRADHIPRLLPAPDNFQALGSRHPCAQRGCITVIAKGYTDPRHIGQKLPQFRRLRQAPAQSNCMNGMNALHCLHALCNFNADTLQQRPKEIRFCRAKRQSKKGRPCPAVPVRVCTPLKIRQCRHAVCPRRTFHECSFYHGQFSVQLPQEPVQCRTTGQHTGFQNIFSGNGRCTIGQPRLWRFRHVPDRRNEIRTCPHVDRYRTGCKYPLSDSAALLIAAAGNNRDAGTQAALLCKLLCRSPCNVRWLNQASQFPLIHAKQLQHLLRPHSVP